MDASSTDGARSPGEFSVVARWLPWAVVALAAILPYLSTLGDYFVRDDFGVVQLLAQKPWWYFPRWFTTPWMDDIWGYTPDEIRPFPAVTYQLTALGGIVSPVLHHVLNIVMHAINAWLVMAIARRAAGLSVAAAAFAGIVFALLPVHTESVAWITGRVDSMPALFYLATFLAFVRFRQRPRASTYVWSLALFFIALFTKQNTITMVATLVGYDVIAGRRPVTPIVGFALPYVPFALMTAGYLWLRYVLFHQVAREGALNARALEDFRILLDRHLRHVVGGSLDAPAVVVWLMLALVGLAWLLLRRAPGGTSGAFGRNLLYFGPIWWAIGVLPIAVAGYHSPRHVYLAAVGWAVVLGVVYDAACRYRPSTTWQRGVGIGAAARGGLLPRAARAFRSRVEQNGGRVAPGGEGRAYGSAGGAGRNSHRHRRARTQLGMGAAVCGSSALSAHRLTSARVHHFASRAQLLHGAMVRGNTPGDSELVRQRRPRFRHSNEVGSGDWQAVASRRTRRASAGGPNEVAARHAPARGSRRQPSPNAGCACRALMGADL